MNSVKYVSQVTAKERYCSHQAKDFSSFSPSDYNVSVIIVLLFVAMNLMQIES